MGGEIVGSPEAAEGGVVGARLEVQQVEAADAVKLLAPEFPSLRLTKIAASHKHSVGIIMADLPH